MAWCCAVLVVQGDSEKVRNSSPLPRLASSRDPMSNGVAHQMVFGTDLDKIYDLFTAGNWVSILMNLG